MYALIMMTIFIASVLYAHTRGTVRLKFSRQLLDHSTFFGPVNMFMTGLSKLPNQPFYDLEHFPELKPLQENWQIIREEAILLQHKIKAADKDIDVGFHTFFKRGWKRFYLKWYQDTHPSAHELCPKTVALLEKIPSVKAAMFAELPSGSYLGKHRDPYAGSIRYHLGLTTPNNDSCFIEVDNQRYSWRDGEATIFDETYVHWAENSSNQTRIILFCDIERPMKWAWAQKINHWFGSKVMAAASSPNEQQDTTGGINLVFQYFYAIHQYGRKLKAQNQHLYYFVKWCLFASILFVLFLPVFL